MGQLSTEGWAICHWKGLLHNPNLEFQTSVRWLEEAPAINRFNGLMFIWGDGSPEGPGGRVNEGHAARCGQEQSTGWHPDTVRPNLCSAFLSPTGDTRAPLPL